MCAPGLLRYLRPPASAGPAEPVVIVPAVVIAIAAVTLMLARSELIASDPVPEATASQLAKSQSFPPPP